MSELTEITSGLRFPEGPIARPDGSVILVEMSGPRITRVQPDGSQERVWSCRPWMRDFNDDYWATKRASRWRKPCAKVQSPDSARC